MTSDMPIGVFDSGMGGLTVLSALLSRLPHENMLYLGDTARLPYGTKSRHTVSRYALQAAEKLVGLRVKALVIACNTATAAALDDLRAVWPHLPVLGVVEPGAEAACRITRTNRVAVLATESTIRGGAYQRAIKAIKPEISVIGQPCSLFVPLAEEGWMEGPIVEAVARRYLEPLFKLEENKPAAPAVPVAPVAPVSGDCKQPGPDRPVSVEAPDCLVLGCTHFPALAATIGKVLMDLTQDAAQKSGSAATRVHIVDSAATTALAVEKKLQGLGLLNRQNIPGQVHFMTTDDEARFARIGSLFLGQPLDAAQIELVNL